MSAEGRIAWWVATVMIAQQVAGKALRDAFFLSNFDAAVLPQVMTVSSVLSVVLVVAASQAYRRFSPARVTPLLFGLNAGLYALEWLLSAYEPRIAAVLLFVHTTAAGSVAISGFWSVVSERFDPHTAKRVVSQVAGGATLGGVMGGLVAWQGASRISIPTMLIGLGLASLLCAAGVSRLGQGIEAPKTPSQRELSSLEVFEQTPYLRHLAALVALSALAAAAYEYVFKATAAAAFDRTEDLVSFFALYYLGLGIATFLLQNLLAVRVLQRLGLTRTVGTYPAVVVGLGTMAWLLPGLATATALRSMAAMVESSLFRSGYELLYAPLSPEKKRPTKTLIDVGGDKLGAAAGGALAVFIVGLLPGYSRGVLLGLAISSALACIALVPVLYRGYLRSLRESLVDGTLNPEDVDSADQGARATVMETVAAMEADQLQGMLARGRQAPALRTVRPLQAQAGVGPPPLEDPDGTLAALGALASRDPERVAWVLRRHQPLPPSWVPWVIGLLSEASCREMAADALRPVLPMHLGALGDVLLDRSRPLEVRRQVPALVARVATDRSAHMLVQALKAEPFEIRHRAALALGQVVSRNPDVLPPAGELVHEVEREFERECYESVAFAVELLGLITPRDPFLLAVDAMATDDPKRRGTAHEYLENVLPPSVRDRLLQAMEDRQRAAVARRDPELLWAELGRHRRGVRTMEELRQRVQAWYAA